MAALTAILTANLIPPGVTLRDDDHRQREEPDIRRDMPRHTRFPRVGVDTTKGERTRSPFTRGWVSLPATGLSGP